MKIALIAGSQINKKSNYGFDMRIGWIADGLVERGHDVSLYSLPGSKSKAKLVKIFKYKNIDCKKEILAAKLIEDAGKFDIIHSHSIEFIILSRLTNTPIVHTVSFSDFPPNYINIYKTFNNVLYIAQSKFLKKKYNINWGGVVYNGISTQHFKSLKNANRNYFLTLSRIHPEKGVHLAVEYCHKHKLKLIIAGMIQDQKYFDNKIKKYLGGNIKYVGEVGFKEKIKLYQKAKALLCPIQYNETFSNAMIEAMSCGTPIISLDKGSAKEVIKHNKTGFVIKNMREFEKAINNIDQIKFEDCRQRVVDNFSYQKMAEGYEKMYLKK